MGSVALHCGRTRARRAAAQADGQPPASAGYERYLRLRPNDAAALANRAAAFIKRCARAPVPPSSACKHKEPNPPPGHPLSPKPPSPWSHSPPALIPAAPSTTRLSQRTRLTAPPPSLPFPLRVPYRTDECVAASRFTHTLAPCARTRAPTRPPPYASTLGTLTLLRPPRDLKPGNVFLGAGETIKLGDLGIAKVPPPPGRVAGLAVCTGSVRVTGRSFGAGSRPLGGAHVHAPRHALLHVGGDPKGEPTPLRKSTFRKIALGLAGGSRNARCRAPTAPSAPAGR